MFFSPSRTYTMQSCATSPRSETKEGKRRRLTLPEVNSYITCPLCKGYFIDATTLPECTHSFCRSCLMKHMETFPKCPVCDKPIEPESLESLRFDQTLQSIVYKMVPGLHRNEAKRRLRVSMLYSEDELDDGTPEAKRRKRHEQGDQEDGPIIFDVNDYFSLCLHVNPRCVHAVRHFCVLNQQKDENEVEKSPEDIVIYLNCKALVPISILKKFIRSKYKLSESYKVDLFCGGETLCDNYTLMDVGYIFKWKQTEPLKLSFCIYEIEINPKMETGENLDWMHPLGKMRGKKLDSSVEVPESGSLEPPLPSMNNIEANQSENLELKPVPSVEGIEPDQDRDLALKPGPSMQEVETSQSEGLALKPGSSMQEVETSQSEGLALKAGPSMQEVETSQSEDLALKPGLSMQDVETSQSEGLALKPGPSMQEVEASQSEGLALKPGPSMDKTEADQNGHCRLKLRPSMDGMEADQSGGLQPKPVLHMDATYADQNGDCKLKPGPSMDEMEADQKDDDWLQHVSAVQRSEDSDSCDSDTIIIRLEKDPTIFQHHLDSIEINSVQKTPVVRCSANASHQGMVTDSVVSMENEAENNKLPGEKPDRSKTANQEMSKPADEVGVFRYTRCQLIKRADEEKSSKLTCAVLAPNIHEHSHHENTTDKQMTLEDGTCNQDSPRKTVSSALKKTDVTTNTTLTKCSTSDDAELTTQTVLDEHKSVKRSNTCAELDTSQTNSISLSCGIELQMEVTTIPARESVDTKSLQNENALQTADCRPAEGVERGSLESSKPINGTCCPEIINKDLTSLDAGAGLLKDADNTRETMPLSTSLSNNNTRKPVVDVGMRLSDNVELEHAATSSVSLPSVESFREQNLGILNTSTSSPLTVVTDSTAGSNAGGGGASDSQHITKSHTAIVRPPLTVIQHSLTVKAVDGSSTSDGQSTTEDHDTSVSPQTAVTNDCAAVDVAGASSTNDSQCITESLSTSVGPYEGIINDSQCANVANHSSTKYNQDNSERDNMLVRSQPAAIKEAGAVDIADGSSTNVNQLTTESHDTGTSSPPAIIQDDNTSVVRGKATVGPSEQAEKEWVIWSFFSPQDSDEVENLSGTSPSKSPGTKLVASSGRVFIKKEPVNSWSETEHNQFRNSPDKSSSLSNTNDQSESTHCSSVASESSYSTFETKSKSCVNPCADPQASDLITNEPTEPNNPNPGVLGSLVKQEQEEFSTQPNESNNLDTISETVESFIKQEAQEFPSESVGVDSSRISAEVSGLSVNQEPMEGAAEPIDGIGGDRPSIGSKLLGLFIKQEPVENVTESIESTGGDNPSICSEFLGLSIKEEPMENVTQPTESVGGDNRLTESTESTGEDNPSISSELLGLSIKEEPMEDVTQSTESAGGDNPGINPELLALFQKQKRVESVTEPAESVGRDNPSINSEQSELSTKQEPVECVTEPTESIGVVKPSISSELSEFSIKQEPTEGVMEPTEAGNPYLIFNILASFNRQPECATKPSEPDHTPVKGPGSAFIRQEPQEHPTVQDLSAVTRQVFHSPPHFDTEDSCTRSRQENAVKCHVDSSKNMCSDREVNHSPLKSSLCKNRGDEKDENTGAVQLSVNKDSTSVAGDITELSVGKNPESNATDSLGKEATRHLSGRRQTQGRRVTRTRSGKVTPAVSEVIDESNTSATSPQVKDSGLDMVQKHMGDSGADSQKMPTKSITIRPSGSSDCEAAHVRTVKKRALDHSRTDAEFRARAPSVSDGKTRAHNKSADGGSVLALLTSGERPFKYLRERLLNNSTKTGSFDQNQTICPVCTSSTISSAHGEQSVTTSPAQRRTFTKTGGASAQKFSVLTSVLTSVNSRPAIPDSVIPSGTSDATTRPVDTTQQAAKSRAPVPVEAAHSPKALMQGDKSLKLYRDAKFMSNLTQIFNTLPGKSGREVENTSISPPDKFSSAYVESHGGSTTGTLFPALSSPESTVPVSQTRKKMTNKIGGQSVSSRETGSVTPGLQPAGVPRAQSAVSANDVVCPELGAKANRNGMPQVIAKPRVSLSRAFLGKRRAVPDSFLNQHGGKLSRLGQPQGAFCGLSSPFPYNMNARSVPLPLPVSKQHDFSQVSAAAASASATGPQDLTQHSKDSQGAVAQTAASENISCNSSDNSINNNNNNKLLYSQPGFHRTKRTKLKTIRPATSTTVLGLCIPRMTSTAVPKEQIRYRPLLPRPVIVVSDKDDGKSCATTRARATLDKAVFPYHFDRPPSHLQQVYGLHGGSFGTGCMYPVMQLPFCYMNPALIPNANMVVNTRTPMINARTPTTGTKGLAGSQALNLVLTKESQSPSHLEKSVNIVTAVRPGGQVTGQEPVLTTPKKTVADILPSHILTQAQASGQSPAAASTDQPLDLVVKKV